MSSSSQHLYMQIFKESLMDPLEEYIKKELSKGFSKREIYEKLIATGYKAEKVTPLFEKFPEESRQGNRRCVAMTLIIIVIVGRSCGAMYGVDFTEKTSGKTTLLPDDYDFDDETGMIRV